jgi:hypothetical protein
MTLLLNPSEINSTLSYKNTHQTVFFSPREHEYDIVNKMPMELSTNLSTLIDSFDRLIFRLKEVQNLIDREFTSDIIINEFQDHQTLYELPDPFHKIYPVIHKINNSVGYTLNHEIYDSFGINSKLSEILDIDPIPKLVNLLDVIHIKPHTTIPYHIHRSFDYNSTLSMSPKLDGVECLIPLSGDMKLYASTHPRTSTSCKYQEIVPKNKIIAFNPEILHTGVALTEDVYLLYLRFNSMSFTELLKKQR